MQGHFILRIVSDEVQVHTLAILLLLAEVFKQLLQEGSFKIKRSVESHDCKQYESTLKN